MAGNTNNANIWQEAVAATKDCPTLEVLEQVMEQSSLDPKTAAHLAECPHCQSEIAMLRSFESSSPSENEGAAVAWIAAQLERNQKAPAARSSAKVVPFWRAMFRLPYMTAAAALAVAVTLGVSLYHSDNGRPPIHAPQYGIYRSGEIKLTTPSDLNQPPAQLTWEALPGASSYSVEVDDVTGDKIWESKSTTNSIKLDPDLKAKMVPGKPLKWSVTAVDTNGKEFATGKGTFRVVVNR
ncbi:MAG TPA: hypothetical protein VLN58_00320 [Verrucomicrobiae bacterium]|nr:hypothetical protein [Verrucomicrobiae bacterium]